VHMFGWTCVNINDSDSDSETVELWNCVDLWAAALEQRRQPAQKKVMMKCTSLQTKKHSFTCKDNSNHHSPSQHLSQLKCEQLKFHMCS
jgi:hypothetical protein